MAFDHWWLSFLAGKDEYECLLPDFMAAAEKAAMSPESLPALVAWRHRPSDFEEAAAMSEQLTAQAHAFIWAFNLNPAVAFVPARKRRAGAACWASKLPIINLHRKTD